jgi:hypothetical protein
LGDEEEIALWLESRAGENRHRDGAHRRLILHVERSAAPQVAVIVEMTGERGMPPVPGVGGNHVGVAKQRKRRTLAAAGDASHEVGPLGRLGHQLAFDACRLQVVLEQQGGRSLAAWRIRRVYPQQRAEQGSRFLPQGGIAGLLHAQTPRERLRTGHQVTWRERIKQYIERGHGAVGADAESGRPPV